jgi:hypothetical protein
MKIHSIDESVLLPIPQVSAKHGALSEEEKRVLKLINEGLESGPAIDADANFFDRLHSRLPPKP